MRWHTENNNNNPKKKKKNGRITNLTLYNTERMRQRLVRSSWPLIMVCIHKQTHTYIKKCQSEGHVCVEAFHECVRKVESLFTK